MPDRLLQDATNMSGGAAVASGLLTFLSENPQLIGLILSGVSVVSVIIFGILNYRLNRKRLLLTLENSEKTETRLTDEDIEVLKKLLAKKGKK